MPFSATGLTYSYVDFPDVLIFPECDSWFFLSVSATYPRQCLPPEQLPFPFAGIEFNSSLVSCVFQEENEIKAGQDSNFTSGFKNITSCAW